MGTRTGHVVHGDAGAGAAAALAIAAAILTVALAGATAGSAFVVRQRAVASADAAALAAADVRLGAVPGVPCEEAARVAAAHDTELTSCALDGATAEVAVRATALGIPVEISSRAGAAADPG